MAAKGKLAMPSVGDAAKVWLPGETPWAICMAVHEDGSWEGKIDNLLFAEMPEKDRQAVWLGSGSLPRLHNYKRDQIVRFKKVEHVDCDLWEPAEQAPGRA